MHLWSQAKVVNLIMKDKSRGMEQEINKVFVHHSMMLKEIQEKRKQASQFDTSAAEIPSTLSFFND